MLRKDGISVLSTLNSKGSALLDSQFKTDHSEKAKDARTPNPYLSGSKEKNYMGADNEFVFKYMQHIVAQLLADFHKVDIGEGEVQQGLARFHYEFIKSSLIKLDF